MKNKNVAGRGRPFTQIASTALLLPLLLANARAADVPVESKPGPADPVDIEVFEGARPVKAPGEWAYPFSEKKHHREGWVLLNMMIDPKGKPYEVRVLDSSGNRVLDSAAVKAVNDMAFQPGKNGGTPIDSSLTFKMAFYLKGEARGASREFVAAYTSFSKALDAGDKAQADAELRKVQVENLYEDAFKSYAQYLYDRKWGTDAEQLADLRRALAGDKDGQYLPKELFAGDDLRPDPVESAS